MNYQVILESIINEIQSKKQNEYDDSILEKKAMDVAIARVIVTDPYRGPRFISNDTGIDYDYVLSRLRASYLSRPSNREKWIELSKLFSNVFITEPVTPKLKTSLLKIKNQLLRYNRTHLTALIFWLILIKTLQEQGTYSQHLILMENGIEHVQRRDIRTLHQQVYWALTSNTQNVAFVSPTQYLQQLNELKTMIMKDNQDLFTQAIQDMTIESLQEQNLLLKNYLTLIIEELEVLAHDFDHALANMKTTLHHDFLKSLNESENGYLLDTLMGLITHFRDDPGNMNPQEISRFLQFFAKYLSKLGVKPIYKINSRKTITEKDLETVEYQGSPFTARATEKLVQFTTTGWKYNASILSKAKAMEVEE